ncbi:SRPBCC family protein [Rhodococcus sp. HM1]|uniref:SRPBCC family protein n=1 Tax=unclassified Rhodococcus (in: high G+C Gram-positive bacteria) TaxID=192944 RepID=UPI0018CC8BF1|nr:MULTISPECIES: SRPBCC family protein [unclassified Rhodococcus (in: high G+C Gram-positive bacteria)]MBH0119585.1 SRPBCC family protein [Rhodococcus sp. CX]MCK8671639.1 SRPBCC family protein [Rhodococcus sp. HM1]
MFHVRHSAVAAVPLDIAFAYVDDHRTVPEWMFGVSRFEPVGAQVSGLGAVFDAAMQIGPKSLDTRLEVVEWERDRIIVLNSVAGFRTSSSWTFTDLGDSSRLDVDFGYELPGGLAGRALGMLIEPVVGTAVRQTEQALRTRLGQLV